MRNYVTGLLLDGERKSVQPMAERFASDAAESDALRQRLQDCVSLSPWSDEELLRRLTLKFDREMPGIAPVVADRGVAFFFVRGEGGGVNVADDATVMPGADRRSYRAGRAGVRAATQFGPGQEPALARALVARAVVEYQVASSTNTPTPPNPGHFCRRSVVHSSKHARYYVDLLWPPSCYSLTP
jgi:hypothetical protein